MTDVIRALAHADDRAILDANGKRIRSLRAAEAADAVGKYFKDYPEAGQVPYFHHRVGIVAAVLRVLTEDR